MEMMQMMQDLNEGRRIPLQLREDANGQFEIMHWVELEEDDVWIEGKVLCMEAEEFNLGSCKCIEHSSVSRERISKEEAERLLG